MPAQHLQPDVVVRAEGDADYLLPTPDNIKDAESSLRMRRQAGFRPENMPAMKERL